jgi:eukaryotic-like serine/threonine-protein kinase
VILFGSLGGIRGVSAAGGTAVLITALDASRAENRDIFPVFLPDNRHFLYLRISNAMENSGIVVGSLDSPPDQQNAKPFVATVFGAQFVPSPDSRSGSLLLLRDQTLISQPFDLSRLEPAGDPTPVAARVGSSINAGFFSVSRNGLLVYRTGLVNSGATVQLTWFDAQGNKLDTAWEPLNSSNFALAPDASRAAVTRLDVQTANRDIWIFDFARRTPTRFTFGSGSSNNPVWAPDGSRLFYSSFRAGTMDLYQRPSSLTTDEQLVLKSGGTTTPTSLSRDGRLLLYTVVDPKQKNDLCVLPLEGDRKPIAIATSEFNESDGRFSPDGRWIAYVTDDSKRNEVVVREFSNTSLGAKWQVSVGGGTSPRWDRDGKALFYTSLDGTVMRVDIKPGQTFQADAPRPLFTLPPGALPPDTVDGKRFLTGVPSEQDAQTPFTVLVNWQASLKK